MYKLPIKLIINLYKSLVNIIKEMPFMESMQWMYIPVPIPNEALIPSTLPKVEACLITMTVSGPGLVKAIKCAIADQININ